MAASITFEEAVEEFKKNHRMGSECPNTYPHVIDGTIAPSAFRGKEAIGYFVAESPGRTTYKRWIYEADYPGERVPR